MITVNEAKELTKQGLIEAKRTELNTISEKIKAESICGKSDLFLNHLFPETIDELRKNGFYVEEQTNTNGDIRISWQ